MSEPDQTKDELQSSNAQIKNEPEVEITGIKTKSIPHKIKFIKPIQQHAQQRLNSMPQLLRVCDTININFCCKL